MLLASVLVWCASCSTMYVSVITLTAVVDGASKEYAKAFNSGLVPPEVAVKAAATHEAYRKSAGVAKDAFAAVKAGQDSDARAALEAARTAARGFIDVIASLLTKEKLAQVQIQLKKANRP